MKRSTIFWVALTTLLLIIFLPWWLSASFILVARGILTLGYLGELDMYDYDLDDKRNDLYAIRKALLIYWIIKLVRNINKLIDGN